MATRSHRAGLFAAVDDSGDSVALAHYLRSVTYRPQGLREAVDELEALELRPGSRALDVGCGLGETVFAMAERVGPEGRAVGIDASRSFIAGARATQRTAGIPALFVAGDAHALPFADGAFDAVRIERTLQHVERPARVVSEMARVAAAGAVVSIAEPDWSTLVIDIEPTNVTRRVARAFAAGIRNPHVGTSAVRMLAANGLGDVAVRADTVIFRDAGEAEHLLQLDQTVGAAVSRGLSPRSGRAWLAEARRRGNEGTFFAAVTGYFVTARKPWPGC